MPIVEITQLLSRPIRQPVSGLPIDAPMPNYHLCVYSARLSVQGIGEIFGQRAGEYMCSYHGYIIALLFCLFVHFPMPR